MSFLKMEVVVLLHCMSLVMDILCFSGSISTSYFILDNDLFHKYRYTSCRIQTYWSVHCDAVTIGLSVQDWLPKPDEVLWFYLFWNNKHFMFDFFVLFCVATLVLLRAHTGSELRVSLWDHMGCQGWSHVLCVCLPTALLFCNLTFCGFRRPWFCCLHS